MIYGYCTDVGLRKETNEDSLLIKTAECIKGDIVLSMICDGMGGLSNGELASATVIKAFSDWFDTKLIDLLDEDEFSLEDVKRSIRNLIINCNNKIFRYGENNHSKLGTTATGLFALDNEYIIFHVGDTRVYRINQNIELLTEDQTWVNNEIKRGNMTEEEANNDARRNVLLQCIGASRSLIPEFYSGIISINDMYLICSDGFRHELTSDEIFNELKSTEDINNQLRYLIELNKSRNELDNITCLVIHFNEEGC